MQRKKIEEWSKLHEVEIAQWWEEIDQSGAKLQRPMFQQALERGETGVIVVSRLDRFARSAVDALESIKRLNQARARLVSVEENFDGSNPYWGVRDRDPDPDRRAGTHQRQGSCPRP